MMLWFNCSFYFKTINLVKSGCLNLLSFFEDYDNLSHAGISSFWMTAILDVSEKQE